MAFREKVKDRGYRGEDSDDDTKERLSRSRSRSRSPPTSFHRHHLLKSNLSSYAYGNRLKTFRTFDDIFYELLVKIRKENLNPTDYNFTKQYIYNRYIDIAKAEASAIVKHIIRHEERRFRCKKLPFKSQGIFRQFSNTMVS